MSSPQTLPGALPDCPLARAIFEQLAPATPMQQLLAEQAAWAAATVRQLMVKTPAEHDSKSLRLYTHADRVVQRNTKEIERLRRPSSSPARSRSRLSPSSRAAFAAFLANPGPAALPSQPAASPPKPASTPASAVPSSPRPAPAAPDPPFPPPSRHPSSKAPSRDRPIDRLERLMRRPRPDLGLDISILPTASVPAASGA